MDWLETFFNSAFLDPLRVIGRNALALLPNILGMILIVVIGGLIAWLGAQAVERLFRVIRFDLLCQRIGLTSALTRGGVKYAPSYLAGRMVLWLVLGVFVLVGLAVLRLDPVNKLTESLLSYVPYFFTALFIVIGGFLLSNFLSQAVLIAAVNAGLPPARLLAAFTRWAIQLAAIAMALEQLGIAKTIVVVGFGITFGGVVLAAAIAFGLGAKDLAKEFLEQRLTHRPQNESPDDLRHL